MRIWCLGGMDGGTDYGVRTEGLEAWRLKEDLGFV